MPGSGRARLPEFPANPAGEPDSAHQGQACAEHFQGVVDIKAAKGFCPAKRQQRQDQAGGCIGHEGDGAGGNRQGAEDQQQVDEKAAFLVRQGKCFQADRFFR